MRLMTVLAISMTLFGCGDPEGACGGNRSGVTDCLSGALQCSAGQYCDQDQLRCSPGCTSDANCAGGEQCQRESGAAVGVCARCGDVAVSDSALVTRCREAAKKLLGCKALDNQQYGALETACSSMFSDEMRQTFAACVESAAASCSQAATCIQDDSAPDDGRCQDDHGCQSAAGLDHEICQGGFCQTGCRRDQDCGSGYYCDDANPTFPLCMPL